jgi:hypothetical protein
MIKAGKDGETTDELRDHPELDKVLRFHLRQVPDRKKVNSKENPEQENTVKSKKFLHSYGSIVI